MNPVLDTSLHERRRAERMRDPEFRAAYEQAAGAIAQADHIIRTLDEMRAEMGISKAELARQIDRNASSIRRSSPRTRPSQSSRSSPRSPRRSGFAWPSSPRRRRRRGSCASTTPKQAARRALRVRVPPYADAGDEGPRQKVEAGERKRCGARGGPDAALEHSLLPSRRRDGPGLGLPRLLPGQTPREFVAVLDAVAAAPPPQFSGGGKWEAMHGDMTGYYEIRLTGPSREQFRLFCLLENGTDDELVPRPHQAGHRGDRRPAETVANCSEPADYRAVKKTSEGAQAPVPAAHRYLTALGQLIPALCGPLLARAGRHPACGVRTRARMPVIRTADVGKSEGP